MDPSYKHLDKDTLNELLEVYRRNLGVLEVQAAKHGSAYVPLVIAHSIRESKSKIEAIEKELYKYEPNTVTEKQSPKILVIDDDATFREEIVSMLSDEDFVIVEASNGIEGLKLAEAEQPDITLLDIEMPDMDGHTVLAQIVEKRIRTRVLIISAYDNRVNVLIRAGACDYISKMDVNKAVLKTAIQRSLLLDYTVDVILDNPTRIINPLIERLEASYQRERLLRSELKGLINRIKSHTDGTKRKYSLISDADLASLVISEISKVNLSSFEQKSNDIMELMRNISEKAHGLNHQLIYMRKCLEYLRTESQSNKKSRFLDDMESHITDMEQILTQLRKAIA